MFKVNLNSIGTVKEFVNKAGTFSGDIALTSGRYTVDGKSIMGVFSLDLSKDLEVVVSPSNREKEFKGTVKQFVVE